MIGKTAPIKMTNPAEYEVRPNHTIANGIHARGGTGRRISITGSRNASNLRFHPMAIPMGMPMRSDAPSPMAKWIRLASKSWRRVPFQKSAMKANRTSPGPGRMKGSLTRYAETPCHRISPSAIARPPNHRSRDLFPFIRTKLSDVPPCRGRFTIRQDV